MIPEWCYQRGRPLSISLVFLVLISTLSSVQPIASEKLLIVTTTSVLGSVIEDLAGYQVEVIVLVRPTVCPAHHDVRPSDIYAVSRVKLIFLSRHRGLAQPAPREHRDRTLSSSITITALIILLAASCYSKLRTSLAVGGRA